MGRVGHDYLLALGITTLLVIVADNHQSGELSVSTGKGIQSEVSQSGKFGKRLLQVVFHLEGSLTAVCRLGGMEVGKLWEVGYFLIDAGIVLHRTTAEGIETIVDAKVVAAEICVVSYYGQFVTLGQFCIVLTALAVREYMMAEVVAGQAVASGAGA